MKLKELRKKLYKPGTEFEERLKGPEFFKPGRKKEKISAEEWERIKKRKPAAKRKKYLLIGFVSLVTIFLIIAGLMFWHGLTSFDKDKVRLEIRGPERIVSGEEVNYKVRYQNRTRLDLGDVKLVFYYPESSIAADQEELVQNLDLPPLPAGQENQVELSARVMGLRGEAKKVRAELSYQPGKISSRFTNQAEFSSTIISVPLILDFSVPKRLTSGQSFDFSLKYLNQGEVAFDNLWIRLEYPIGFTLESAEPPPLEEDRAWSLGELRPGQEGEIFLRGNIVGEEGEAKLLKAQLGLLKDEDLISYAEAVGGFQVSASPLFVSQTINKETEYIAEAGENLTYRITYKNTTDIGIRDVIITSKLEGKALNLTTLKTGKGSFEGGTQTITWRAGNLPELEFLEAHEEGEIRFSVRVKNPLPIENFNDKNFAITNTVIIDSSQVPLSLINIKITGQSQSITKVVSQLTLQAPTYYYDDTIPNSGPIPPKVGQTTTYTVKWRLINTANDLKNTEVKAYLPPHVQWINKVNPADADLKYNPQTGEVIWRVGLLPAATGILLPVKQAAFQVAITPSLAHLGSLVELIGRSTASGLDDFTGLELESITRKAIYTDLPDDLKVSRRNGTVVE